MFTCMHTHTELAAEATQSHNAHIHTQGCQECVYVRETAGGFFVLNHTDKKMVQSFNMRMTFSSG